MEKEIRFAFKRLDVYAAGVEHFQWVCEVVRRLPRGHYKVIDQAESASLSIMWNIGEAHGRSARAGEIEQHYRYALGSTFESATHLDALFALGVMSVVEYNAAENRLSRISMMLTRLMQKQQKRKRELRLVAVRSKSSAPERETGRSGNDVPTPRAARPAGRSAAAGFDPPTGEPKGAKRPSGNEPPQGGVAEAAQPPQAIEHRARKSAET